MWAVIIGFIKNYYPVVLIIAVYVIIIALMRSSYKEGYSTCDKEWQEKEKAAQFDRLRELRAIETRERQRQSEIIREYTDKLAALEDAQKRQIDQILDASSTAIRNAGDSVCPVQSQSDGMHSNSNGNNQQHDRGRLSSAANNRSGTVCYSEERLRRQIAESVAIAQECDREMKRFKALQDVCKQQ
jgi:hypothetical protein